MFWAPKNVHLTLFWFNPITIHLEYMREGNVMENWLQRIRRERNSMGAINRNVHIAYRLHSIQTTELCKMDKLQRTLLSTYIYIGDASSIHDTACTLQPSWIRRRTSSKQASDNQTDLRFIWLSLAREVVDFTSLMKLSHHAIKTF